MDVDLSNYFGEIPHKELLKSVARRVSDCRMLGLIKLWLEMAVEEEGAIERLNRVINGWKNCFRLGQVSPAYVAVGRDGAYPTQCA